MYQSYDEFPKDKKRTEKIIKLLKAGESALPIYVKKMMKIILFNVDI